MKAGLSTKGEFPETVADGFSVEIGIAFNFDAAVANDGLRTESASVAPPFRFGVEFWSPPGEETEVCGISSGAAVSFAVPVICAVFGTTAPSANVVRDGDVPTWELACTGLGWSTSDAEGPKTPPFCEVGPAPDPEVGVAWVSPEPAVT